MRKSFMFVGLLVLILTGCHSRDVQIDIPEIKLKPVDITDAFMICERSEDEQPKATGKLQVYQDVTVTAERQMVHRKDCHGKVVSEKMETVNSPSAATKIAAPPSLNGFVNYVWVRNQRTCKEFQEQADGKSGEKTLAPYWGANGDLSQTLATRDGEVQFRAYLTHIHVLGGLPVRKGKNIVHFKYFGKCTKYRDNRKPGDPDSVACEKAEVLEDGTLTLNVIVETKELEGVKEEDDCIKDVDVKDGPERKPDVRSFVE